MAHLARPAGIDQAKAINDCAGLEEFHRIVSGDVHDAGGEVGTEAEPYAEVAGVPRDIQKAALIRSTGES